ncbi:MAG: ATP synthase subunit I, partial [Gammaproteobacteria bacterium]
IYLFLGALALIGAVAGVLFKDAAWGASFLLGGAAAALNFRWFHQMVYSIGPGGKRPRRRLVAFLTARYLLLAAGAYVIVKFFGVRPTGLLAGLLLAGIAVMAEILYELIYARA